MIKSSLKKLYYLILLLSVAACKNKVKQVEPTVIDSVANQAEITEQVEAQITAPVFPNTGNTINDFVPTNYGIDLEAQGDLNNDGLKDVVIVLLHKKDTTALRPTLVLFKEGEKYNLHSKSFSVVEPKYREDGYSFYDYEAINIDSGKLVTSMQAMGPAGSIESTYRYLNKNLVLTNINAFSMGAGGQTEQKIDLLKGTYIQTDINTMKEDMPSTTSTKKYKMPMVLFKDSDPSAIMMEAFNKVGN